MNFRLLSFWVSFLCFVGVLAIAILIESLSEMEDFERIDSVASQAASNGQYFEYPDDMAQVSGPANEPFGDEKNGKVGSLETPRAADDETEKTAYVEKKPILQGFQAMATLSNEESFVAGYKMAHLERLEKQAKLERLDWQENGGKTKVSAYLVEDVDTPGQFLIVKNIILSGAEKKSNTYVQVANELILSFQGKLSEVQIKSLTSKYKLVSKRSLTATNALHVSFDKISIETLREYEKALESEPLIKAVSANSLVYASGMPNDPSYGDLWAFKQTSSGFDIDSELAWDKRKDCRSTPVAVLDTGIDPNHPDLKDNILLAEGRNFTSNNASNFNDGNRHGTHVSGTIGAVGDNGVGLAGVCWKASIVPIKVLSDQGAGNSAQVIAGISYAAQQSSAKVLNLSLGGAPPTQAELDAIELVRTRGKLFVAAAGNSNNNNDTNPAYPASYDNDAIISVAAYTEQGDIASFSNYGQNSVDIAAPGQDILSTIPTTLANNPYGRLGGTSMAAPHVAGAVALFWSFAPSFSAAQVKSALLQTARTGSFTKPVAGSRMLDLGAFINSAAASVNFEIDGDRPLSSSNSSSLVVPVSFTEPVGAIIRIELVTASGVIKGRFDRAQARVIFDVPFGYKSLQGDLVVFEEGGRSYVTKSIDYPIDQQKFLAFNEIVTDGISGDLSCRLQFIGAEESFDAKLIYEAKLDSLESCRTICQVIGPMAYSSHRKVSCGTLDKTLYESI